ncbi:MAG TPA: hypothetical protein DCQ64_30475 [Candidatus Rokubacteria bacterium]|nr:hypothetical protein [Candidatus Rokubacteria bacterium]
MRQAWMGVMVLLSAVSLSAQGPPKNPSQIAFFCPDHDRDDQHEIDVVRVSDGVVIATLLGGDPPLTGTEVVVDLNVQPVAFGSYRFVVRAVAGPLRSANSDPSEVWERVPGRPSGIVVR